MIIYKLLYFDLLNYKLINFIFRLKVGVCVFFNKLVTGYRENLRRVKFHSDCSLTES